MISRWIRLAAVALLGLWTAAADGQVVVTKSAAVKLALDLSGLKAPRGGAGAQAAKIFAADLARSGWFRIVRSGGQYRLTGKITGGRSLRFDCRVYDGLHGRLVFSRSYRGKPREARSLAHRAADDVTAALTGRKGIAATRIVMVGTLSGAKELYICDADGANLKQLTHDHAVSVGPRWGPRGRRIVYTSFLKRFPDVYLINIADGRRSRIAHYPGLNTGADISPDGREVALILSKDGNPELYVMDIAGGRLTRVTHTPRAAEATPSWSPDGRRIVFVSDRSGRPQLYIVGREGGRPRRLNLRGFENVAPDWGVDGRIAFCARLGGRYQLAVYDPRSGGVEYPSLGPGDYEDPSWAPDGRHLACTRTLNYRSRVYIIDTMGDAPVALTGRKGDWYSPAWSPE